jgi:hypothetical protein
MPNTFKDFVILIDTREAKPLGWPHDVKTQTATLETADYSCIADGSDLRNCVAIERKSVSDLLSCIGGQRERFERELTRLALIPYRALIIEGCMDAVIEATARTQLHQHAVMGSILAWSMKYGVAPIFCPNRFYAASTVRSLLHHAASCALDTQQPPPSLIEKALLAELRPLQGALWEIAGILERGQTKHPDGDGFNQDTKFHVERARMHLEALAAGDTSESHLEHAACRLLMAIQVSQGK